MTVSRRIQPQLVVYLLMVLGPASRHRDAHLFEHRPLQVNNIVVPLGFRAVGSPTTCGSCQEYLICFRGWYDSGGNLCPGNCTGSMPHAAVPSPKVNDVLGLYPIEGDLPE